ncbi:IclR family transcriptional regulator [Serratia rhizosphaerae]|uniref:IclR family transcriptional regulator n=1 Tax=Serratia rhizosphaerae TaxID=2597702 RepID=A0ABX6GPE3_9GAMM|nr:MULTISPECIES: IclR family transcriptional regulator [Serratia]MBU3894420.1 IclR family transcriptional regulator [Serratia rubidaea]AVJ19113.1 IclR family transcriptional regulator [Serratia sp. MYb239]MEB6338291.1 IclR family transcriptional regulator [Serratia rhizosphaerae]QHA88142.1 IclR family transcriptional regulator [Serratia rhizosphaerae]QNK33359.1 IclR family transcriptional regulator [Serratia sp. JUb9]
MADEQTCKYLIPGLDRGLQLLLAFGEQHKEMTFAELHRLVAMPKATAYRVVQTLEHLGFLERNPRTNTFSLGIKVLRLGFEYIASLDVAQVGQPVIEQLRDRSQCSSHLAIRDGRDVIYIARVSAAGSQINQVSVGTRLPVHQTSLGRMLLTRTTREEFERLYPQQSLPGSGPGTPADRETLWQMVQQDKARGYVIGESFFRHGISSIVYPIFNRDLQVEAVVSIMVPFDQIPAEDRERLRMEVRDAAGKISDFLGAPPRADVG